MFSGLNVYCLAYNYKNIYHATDINFCLLTVSLIIKYNFLLLDIQFLSLLAKSIKVVYLAVNTHAEILCITCRNVDSKVFQKCFALIKNSEY